MNNKSLVLFLSAIIAWLVDFFFLMVSSSNATFVAKLIVFGLLIGGVVLFILSGREENEEQRRYERKATRRAERIAGGANLKPAKPYKKPWYVGGFGFLLVTCLFLPLLFVIFVSFDSEPAAGEYVQGSGAQSSTQNQNYAPSAVEATVSPEANAQPKVIADPVSYSGTGDDVIEVTPFADALYVFEITGNADERYFAVESYDSQNKSDLLVNTTDKYSGITMDTGFDVAMLQVTATGDWQITQRSLYDMDVVEQGQTYSGTGDRIILVRSSGKTASITGNAGERYFSIQSYDSQGRGDLLVNTTDKYDGKVMLNDPIIFQVSAVGDWSITLN